MHKIKTILFITTILLLINSFAFAASSVTQSHYKHGDMNVLVIEWVADTDGSFTSFTTRTIDGVVGVVETDPGSTAPTAAYDITLKNSGGVDIMGGKLGDRSATATETEIPYNSNESVHLTYPVRGPLTLAISNNSVNSATGTVTIYFFTGEDSN